VPSVITPCGGGGSSALVGARMRNTFSESIPNSAQHPIPLDAEDFNVGPMWVTGNPTRLTCKTAGVYELGGNILFAANATGQRQLNIARNGSWSFGELLARNLFQAVSSVGVGTAVVTTGVFRLSVGDYVELLAFQSSGGALAAVSADFYATAFWAILLGTL
jgi:hypothetical protein